MSGVWNALVGAMDVPWFGQLLAAAGRTGCSVLALHRFSTPDGQHVGHDPAGLRRLLAGRIDPAQMDFLVEDSEA